MKIKKGDQVQVITGKNRGQRGTVTRVFPQSDKVIVDGVNILKRHRKAKRDGEKGERVEIASPIHVSNVMLIDADTGKPTRIGYRFEGKEKIRIGRTSGKALK